MTDILAPLEEDDITSRPSAILIPENYKKTRENQTANRRRTSRPSPGSSTEREERE